MMSTARRLNFLDQGALHVRLRHKQILFQAWGRNGGKGSKASLMGLWKWAGALFVNNGGSAKTL